MNGINEPDENGKISNLLDAHAKKKPLDENRKSGQTSGTKKAFPPLFIVISGTGLKNPLVLMSYVTPVMAVATALFSLIMDPWDEFRKSSYFDSTWHIYRSALLMLLGGTLAFFMVLTEFVLVSITSAVTVTIAGVVKEAVTILVAVFYFHDEFTWLKGAGLVTIMFGVSLFNWYKYQKLQDKIASGGDMGENHNNVPAKYVILEDMEDEGDSS